MFPMYETTNVHTKGNIIDRIFPVSLCCGYPGVTSGFSYQNTPFCLLAKDLELDAVGVQSGNKGGLGKGRSRAVYTAPSWHFVLLLKKGVCRLHHADWGGDIGKLGPCNTGNKLLGG